MNQINIDVPEALDIIFILTQMGQYSTLQGLSQSEKRCAELVMYLTEKVGLENRPMKMIHEVTNQVIYGSK